MNNNSEEKINFLQFHMQKVVPKVEELTMATSYKKRKNIQLQIISIIRDAGYDNEAKRMRAIFNL